MNRQIRACMLLALLLAGGLALLPVPPAAAQEPADGDDTATVTPDSGGVGTTFTFTFDGWGESEDYIDYWLIGPGERDNFEEGQFDNEPDAAGRTVWTWTVPAGVWAGTWTMNARGLETYEMVSIPFEITDTTISPDDSGVSPGEGTIGTEFLFFTDAWPGGDPVDVWVLPPGSDDPFALDKIYGDPNEEGYTTWRWVVPANAWGGTWTMNARGKYSEIFVQIPFFIDAPPPSPSVAVVSAPETRQGETLRFFANGYAPGEEIAYWVDAPGERTPVDSGDVEALFANGAGEVRWQWTVPTNARPGQWSMTALGRESYVQHQIVFVVLAGDGTSGDETSDDQPATPQVDITPPEAAAGTTFVFTLRDFGRNEQVQFWLTDPAGETLLEGEVTAEADLNGIARWEWESPPWAATGQWLVTAQGTRNRLLVQGSFVITTNTPPPARGTVSPTVARPGEVLSFFASGFRGEERFSWWATPPQGEIIQGAVERRVNGSGEIAWTWQLPANAPAGRWMVVAFGVDSKTERQILFEVTAPPPDAPPPPPDAPPITSVVSPTAGAPGDTFLFRVEGLVSSDRIGYWATAPDGTIYSVPETEQLIVAQDGSLEWTWTAPADALPGRWQMVIQSSPVDEVVSNTHLSIPFRIDRRE